MTEMGSVPRAESHVCVLGRMSLTCALGCQMLGTRACALSPDVRTGAVETEEGRTMAPPLLQRETPASGLALGHLLFWMPNGLWQGGAGQKEGLCA